MFSIFFLIKYPIPLSEKACIGEKRPNTSSTSGVVARNESGLCDLTIWSVQKENLVMCILFLYLLVKRYVSIDLCGRGEKLESLG